MRKTTEYCVEFKVHGENFYRYSYHGFKDEAQALYQAAHSIREGIVSARVVEQTRRVVKVFKGGI